MKYLICLIVLLISFSAAGQADLLEKRGSKYFYKDEVYKGSELVSIYIDHQESLDLYLAGRSNIRAANSTALIGVPFLVLGIVGLTSGSLLSAGLGYISVLGGVVLELTALIPRARGSQKLKKARKDFNYEMIRRHGYEEDTSLSLQINQGGMALVFTF